MSAPRVLGTAAIVAAGGMLACGRSARANPAIPPTATVASSSSVATAPAIPPAYQGLYEDLSGQLDAWEAAQAAEGAAGDGSTVFGAELIVANGNRGEALLDPATRPAVTLFLDRLQAIGVGGVTVQISDPLLWPEFPRHQEFAAFFTDVADEVRRRDLRLIVETGPAFIGTAYSPLDFDWSRLSRDEYLLRRREQIVWIAANVRPDYLSIGSEPETEARLTGFDVDPLDYLRFVSETTDQVDRAGGLRLGSGSGTWEDPTYARLLSSSPDLDFVNVHLYPLSNGVVDYWARAAETADEARTTGKEVILGESWLYKASVQEVRGRIDFSEVYRRDAFSFWQPLDVRFLRSVARLAEAHRFSYVSFFWSGLFFAYLDYQPSLEALSGVELSQRLNRDQYEALGEGRLSPTGDAYRSLLSGGP